MTEDDIDIMQSSLVPKHEIMSEEEKSEFIKQYNISIKQLPHIRQDDPVVKKLGANKGDVIRITREDETTGEYFYYRVVV